MGIDSLAPSGSMPANYHAELHHPARANSATAAGTMGRIHIRIASADFRGTSLSRAKASASA